MSAASASESAWLRAMPVVFVLIWSTGFIVARYGMAYAPPLSFLAARYFVSILCFVLWMKLADIAWPSDTTQWGHLAVTGLLIHAGYLGGVWVAVKLGMGAGLSALIVGLQPVLTALWVSAQGSLGNQVSRRQWLGLVVGLAGVAAVVWHKLGLGEVSVVNFAFALLALLCITSGTLYQKRFVTPCDVRSANAVQLLAALAVTAPLACLEAEAVVVNSSLLGALAWSVLVLTLGGSSLLYMLIQRGAATKVTSLMYLVPPTTALMAWVLFNEAITALTLVGTALAALGVALVMRAPATTTAEK